MFDPSHFSSLDSPWHLNVTFSPCATSRLWGWESKLGRVSSMSTLLSLVCWRASLLDSSRDASGTFSGSLNEPEALFMPCDSFFTMFWLLTFTRFDVFWPAADFPSVDLLIGCEDSDDVIFGSSVLVPVVVDGGVRVSVVAVRMDVLEGFCLTSKPLVLCLTTHGFERSWDALGMLWNERMRTVKWTNIADCKEAVEQSLSNWGLGTTRGPQGSAGEIEFKKWKIVLSKLMH